MKQIVILSMIIFIFSGCLGHQTVQLKLRNSQDRVLSPVKEKTNVVDEQNTVVEEFVPMDIKETNGPQSSIKFKNINYNISMESLA